MVLLSWSALLFFGGVLPIVLLTRWVFRSQEGLAKIRFFLGLVFETHFRERTLVFGVLLRSLVFSVVFCLCFCLLISFFLRKMLGKNSLLLRSGF